MGDELGGGVVFQGVGLLGMSIYRKKSLGCLLEIKVCTVYLF